MMSATFTSQQRFSAQKGNVIQHAAVGCVKEIMTNENRVAMTPDTVKEFTLNGHQVYMQTGAGAAAGFEDQMYVQAGATMMQNPQEVYQKSQIMMKVMQPTSQEHAYIQQQQIIFCFLDANNGNDFIQNMMQKNVVVFNYESFSDSYTFPIMNAMSEVAGHLAVQQGMKYMEKQMGGYGKMLAQVAGIEASQVLILGGGVAASRAATFASKMGACVTIMDISTENLRHISQQVPANVKTMLYTRESLENQLPNTDLMIGAVMPHDFQASMLVNKEQMKLMKPMSVVVDLAMEFGGNFETSQITTWEKPTFMYNDIIHFCVRNITHCVPRTASQAMSYAVLPYALQVANMGWKQAAVKCTYLLRGILVADKHFTNEKLSSAFNMKFTPVEMVLEQDIKKAAEKNNSNAWNLKHQLNMLNANRSEFKMYTIEA